MIPPSNSAAGTTTWIRSLPRNLRLPGVTTRVIEPRGVVLVPRLEISWDASHPLSGEDLRLRLLQNDPRIMLDDMATGPNSAQVDPSGCSTAKPNRWARPSPAPCSNPRNEARNPHVPRPSTFSGKWRVTVRFLHGDRTHDLSLHQDGTHLTGEQHSDGFAGPVTGEITGQTVSLTMQARYEGSTIFLPPQWRGLSEQHARQVVLGSMTDHHQGPINLGQFGTAAWEAVRACRLSAVLAPPIKARNEVH